MPKSTIEITVVPNDTAVKHDFKELLARSKKMFKKVNNKLSTEIRKQAKAKHAATFEQHTGQGYAGYTKKARSTGFQVGNETWYMGFFEDPKDEGPFVIKPEKKPFLQFKVDGSYVRTEKPITVPKHQIVKPLIEENLRSKKVKAVVNRILQKEINKVLKKGGQFKLQ
jgi:hypothetical protein